MTVIPSSVSNVSSRGTAFDLEIFTNLTRSNFKVTSNLAFFHTILLKPVKLSFGRRGWSALPTKSIFHILVADSYKVSNEEPVSSFPHGDPVEKNSCLADVILNSETTSLTADARVNPNVKPKRRRPSRKSEMPPVKTEELVPGASFIGKVRAVQPFGAFVDFGAFTEGLIHISNLSSGFVTDVKSIVSVGQEVRVYVVNVNVEARQISLTMRESHVSENSNSSSRRNKKSSKLVKGKELEGTVKALQKVGSEKILPEQVGGSLPISKESFEDSVNSVESSLRQVHVEVTPMVSHVAEEKVSKVPPVKTEELVSGASFTGRVTSIKPFGAFVDIGAFTEGLVHISNMKDGFVPDINGIVSIGQEVRVKVLEMNVEKRRISLTMRESSDTNDLQQKKDSSSGGTSDKPISSTKFVKGQELEGTVKNLKKVGSDTNLPKQEGGSLPISKESVEDLVNCMESSLRQVHEELTPMVSHVVKEKFSEVPPVKTENLVHGASFTGRVTSIKPFGAFIDIGAFTEGLVHISNMKDGFVSDINSIVSIGQEVRVKVLETNVDKRRISLSMRESSDINDLHQKQDSSSGSTSDAPISSTKFVMGQELEGTEKNIKKVESDTNFPEQEGGSLPISKESFEDSFMKSSLKQVHEEVTSMVSHGAEENVSKVPPVKTEELVHGASFTGRVTSIKPFGAFVDIGAFTDGLAHISNMKDGFVSDVNSIVSIGQEVRVMVLETDVEKRRISLTMRESSDINDIQQRKDSSSGSTSDKLISATKTKKKNSKLIKGQELVGTVKSLNKGGSIISLPESEEGFLPRSEESVEDIVNVMGGSSLQVDQEIKVRVLHVARGQVILTMKEEDDVKKQGPEVFHIGVVHKATNPFVLAFLKNKDIAKFLDERENMQKLAESP